MRIGINHFEWGTEIVGHTSAGKTSMAYGLAAKALAMGKSVMLACDDLEAERVSIALSVLGDVGLSGATPAEIEETWGDQHYDVLILDIRQDDARDPLLGAVIAEAKACGSQIYLLRPAKRNEMVGEV